MERAALAAAAFVERSPGPYPFVLDADYPGSHETFAGCACDHLCG